MRKLTEQQIVRAHQMIADGIQVKQVARQLAVHRNTITRHLMLRCAYSLQMLRKVGSPRRWDNHTKSRVRVSKGLPCTDRITPTDAAIYLPGWPSPARLAKLRAEGIVEVHRDGYMTEPMIRRTARRMMPLGVWFDSRSLHAFFGDACYEIAEQFSGLRRHHSPFRHTEYYYLPAPPIVAEYSPTIPVGDMSRVSECLRISGVATL